MCSKIASLTEGSPTTRLYIFCSNDDWTSPDGTIITPPSTPQDSMFSMAYNYCLNWCIDSIDDSLFTYSDGESFDGSLCNVAYDGDMERAVSDPSPEVSALCGDDVACLVDGWCGDVTDAQRALDGSGVILAAREGGAQQGLVSTYVMKMCDILHPFKIINCSCLTLLYIHLLSLSWKKRRRQQRMKQRQPISLFLLS